MSSETAVKFHQRLKVKQAYFKQGESSGHHDSCSSS